MFSYLEALPAFRVFRIIGGPIATDPLSCACAGVLSVTSQMRSVYSGFVCLGSFVFLPELSPLFAS